jgi:hypothetical protein
MPELGMSLTIVILTTLEVSLMLQELRIILLENNYITGVSYDDVIFILQAAGTNIKLYP